MKDNIKKIILMTIGCMLSSTGVYCFAVSAGVPVTGVAGITSILYRLYGLRMGFLNLLINIPIIVCCYKALGKKYFIRSAYCMLVYSLFTDYILCYVPIYNGNRLLSAICCGLVMSLGDAMIYMCNSSTGGFDFISVAIKVKMPHLKLGNINLAQAAFIIILNGIIFKDIDSMIYGLIMNYISSRVVNGVIMGFNRTMMMMIITDKGKAVCDVIVEKIDRGSTILDARGGYKEDKKEIVICACNPRQTFLAEKEIRKIDPYCFLILLESSEIHGKGFQMVKFGAENE